jgi:hypothetical protein
MNIEKIGEPIAVLASFTGGKADPLRFRWAGRTYKVQVINGRWTDRQGDLYSLHYSVPCDGQTYYLHFSSKQVQWWLDETITE